MNILDGQKKISLREIDEDFGGFQNLIEMYLPNDTSAQKNYIKKLNQYKDGIYG